MMFVVVRDRLCSLLLVACLSACAFGAPKPEAEGLWGWDGGDGCAGQRSVVRLAGTKAEWIENGKVIRTGSEMRREVTLADADKPVPTGMKWLYVVDNQPVVDVFVVSQWNGKPRLQFTKRVVGAQTAGEVEAQTVPHLNDKLTPCDQP